ncbi:MAG: LptF/LptG family permease [Massilibacteroides sp.]|nr:LptF/LptG family permease [Massilibacteroides sp.]
MLQTFFPLLIMTFGICLFIVLMQFIWRYIDDMVGKGFEMTVLGEMLFYAALFLVPQALPLSILLASLMVFGNLGEKLELLAMKSAGVSLLRIMRPLIIFISLVSIGAFFFQNNVMPVVQVKLWTLIHSMRQKSPELNIPESVFCKEIPDYNLYVKGKDKTGLLKDIMIYNYSQGFEKVDVTLADSGRLKTSADKLFLVLTLYNGESFQNMPQSSGKRNEAVPYRRESFTTKELLIDFNANFIRTDESFLQNEFMGKNLETLQSSIDSMDARLDSVKAINAQAIVEQSYRKTFIKRAVPEQVESQAKKDDEVWAYIPQNIPTLNFDSLFLAEPPSSQAAILGRVKSSIDNIKAEYYFKSFSMADQSYKLRRHMMEWHMKFTLSFSCLVFFFIGAPIGAIIRKGGLGTPVVVSVFMFIFYYMINNIGQKMARDGIWAIWEGMWLSSFVLAPIGIFLTYKAVNDSVILNADTYLNALKNLFGKKETRKIEKKEVIIFDPDYQALALKLPELENTCHTYLIASQKRFHYFRFWKQFGKPNSIPEISDKMEHIVEDLSNSDQNLVLNKLMDYPIIKGYSFQIPNKLKKLNLLLGLVFPIGVPLYFIAMYQRKLLLHDIQLIEKVSSELSEMIKQYSPSKP